MYYLALVLPPPLNEKILYWKKYMLEKYNCKVGVKSPAHITLIPPYWMNPEKEEELLRDTDDIARTAQPFVLASNNFSAFKPRTIFVAVKESEALQQLKKTTEQFFCSKEYGIKKENRPFHPHITIATRDLHKKDFQEVWPVFEREIFEEEWLVDALSVLRHNKKNWDVIHTSQFQNV